MREDGFLLSFFVVEKRGKWKSTSPCFDKTLSETPQLSAVTRPPYKLSEQGVEKAVDGQKV